MEIAENNITIYYKNGITYNYLFEELKVIELYKSAGMDKGNFPLRSNERFYFANIKARDDKHL